uniref:hypothetical protein n=1 Tax=Sneathia vaginalis TaxID=187101 RepID=UPI0040477793
MAFKIAKFFDMSIGVQGNLLIWRNFQKVIDRAMIACENSGHEVEYDFAKVSKIVEAGATNKSIKDYEL